ncbi:MAG: hypothetical protein ACI9LX_003066, partial [Paraglaciecola sp.]
PIAVPRAPIPISRATAIAIIVYLRFLVNV